MLIVYIYIYIIHFEYFHMATEQIVDPFMIMIAISGFFSATVLVSSLLTIRNKKIQKNKTENNI